MHRPRSRPRTRPAHLARAALLALAGLCSAAPTAGAQRRGPSVPVEVFAGRLDFSDDVGLPGQEPAGARIGLDVADFVGLRGFYWRGIEDGRAGVAPVQGFGAEAQLNLNSGNGVTPYLVGGVGRLDFLDAYRSRDSIAPPDRNLALVGGGLRLDVWRVGVQLAARSYLFETAEGDAVESRDLRSNLLYSAGIAFRLGGGSTPQPVVAPPPVAVAARDSVVYLRGTDTVRVATAPERTVTLPVPVEGELYVRYGPVDTLSLVRGAAPGTHAPAAAAPSTDAVAAQVLAALEPRLRELLGREREAIRDIVRAEVARETGRGLAPDAERRLLERVDALVVRRLGPVVVVRGDSADAAAAPRERFRPRLRGVAVYSGMNVNRPRQGLLGSRVDLGPLRPSRPALRVVPELALGFGQGGTSLLLAGNLRHAFDDLRVGGVPFEPYLYAGPGVVLFSDPPQGRPRREVTVNVGYGVATPLPHLGARRVFLEHQGVDLFDLNRVVVGVRL